MITGRVTENVTACEVDADCFLAIEFSDTVVTAIYGTGERPRPPCVIPVRITDMGFSRTPGELVRVEIGRCEGEGYFIRDMDVF